MIELSVTQRDFLLKKKPDFLNRLFRESEAFKAGQTIIVFHGLPSDLLREATKLINQL